MTDIRTDLLSGHDRIEMWTAAGRPLRMGTPLALESSERDAILQALARRDTADSMARLGYFLANVGFMLSTYTELALALPAAALSQVGVEHAAEEYARAWTMVAPHVKNALFRETFEKPGDLEAFRATAAGGATIATPLIAAVSRPGEQALEAIAAGDFERAATLASACIDAYRDMHDLLALLAAAHGAAILALFGQDVALQSQHEAFTRSSFFEPLWQMTGMLAPDELAAVLADHLRYHMSGPSRDGAVRIVEEADRYRIVLDACGSGGAMRRQLGPEAMGLLQEPSPYTWGRRGEVPMYCSHCALNEVESVRRFGYPAFVTEFEPDAARPCAWSVFKNRDAIPQRYYDRLNSRARSTES